MNERIRELAAQAGIGWDEKYHWYVGHEQMTKFAQLIAAAEREKIAQMFDSKVWAYDYREIAAAIRARRGGE